MTGSGRAARWFVAGVGSKAGVYRTVWAVDPETMSPTRRGQLARRRAVLETLCAHPGGLTSWEVGRASGLGGAQSVLDSLTYEVPAMYEEDRGVPGAPRVYYLLDGEAVWFAGAAWGVERQVIGDPNLPDAPAYRWHKEAEEWTGAYTRDG